MSTTLMSVLIKAILFLYVLSGVQGLELTMDVNTLTSHGQRALCGVLTCVESLNTVTHNNNMSTANASPRKNISSLSIYREKAGESTSEDKHLITSISVDRPKISSVSNGITVDGSLEAGKATLRLGMVKQVDCQAMYSCELRTSDGQGNQFVHTNRLRQRSEMRAYQAGDTGATPGVLLQQLGLLQQQMTIMAAALDGKFRDVESRLDILQTIMATTLNEKLESRLDILQSRLEDKIETRVVDKLCEVESKLPVIESDRNVIPQRLSEVMESLKTFDKTVKDENEKIVKLNALAISNSTSTIVATVQGRMTDMLSLEHKNRLRCDRLIQGNERIINSSEEFGHRVQADFSALRNNLQTDFGRLNTDLQNRSSETLSAVRNLISETNSTMWNSLKPVVLDILRPRECRKNMFPSLLGTAFPYHVIQPDAGGEPGAPYLCDSVTAGGGWLVIQRRDSGGLNFYRDWAQYKNGFGSLYGDFWWGNEKIHALTSKGTYELRVDLKYKGKSGFAHYSSFSLDGENNNYVLRLGAYDGTAGDSLSYHNGKPFSTHDRDNDMRPENRAESYWGAWWYDGHRSNLNGKWSLSGVKAARWHTFSDSDSVTFSEMKIRKV
ncbi:hypothetical protein EGW08_002564 [Elysia chlorotica]|uniref:Fibrinogen C-terminal domain-containing protein n=1 Tax=Elysia chlorotica TaxID=188477 RepID=A0A433U753_ELYCH|nr:hypothetical protein EGW08_002564 [Elysia chlorotica]